MFVAVGNPVFDIIKTPQVETHDRVISGCSTNACLVWGKLGYRAGLLGSIGKEQLQLFHKEMTKFDIDLEMLLCSESGGFELIYDMSGNRVLNILGIGGEIKSFPDRFANAQFILIGPILGEVSGNLIRKIKDISRAPIMLDPQGMVRKLNGRSVEYYKNGIEEVISLCDIVKANEHEARVITGFDPRLEPDKAVRALFDLGCKIAIVTIAEQGSVIFDGKQVYTIPAFPVTAIDPTGAGDTYAAGFIIKYCEGHNDLNKIGCFASSVASIMVENCGPKFPLNEMEVNRRAKALEEVINER